MNIDFEGLIAGQPFEGNQAANFAVVLGENRMLPDFEAALVGMRAGEQKTFPLTFPQDYAEAVRGKTADFTVTVNQVAEPKLPAVDADFAKSLGVEDGDVERLKREVRENMDKEVVKRVRAKVKEQVMDALHGAASFEVPKSLLDGEIERMQRSALEDLKQRGMTVEDKALPRGPLRRARGAPHQGGPAGRRPREEARPAPEARAGAQGDRGARRELRAARAAGPLVLRGSGPPGAKSRRS